MNKGTDIVQKNNVNSNCQSRVETLLKSKLTNSNIHQSDQISA